MENLEFGWLGAPGNRLLSGEQKIDYCAFFLTHHLSLRTRSEMFSLRPIAYSFGVLSIASAVSLHLIWK
jgi:uncharacterized membrane protein YhhN